MKLLLFVVLIMSFYGCSEPEKKDFVGIWFGDNVILELRDNGTCIVSGTNAYLLLEENADSSIVRQFINGKWQLEEISSPYNRKIIRVRLVDRNTGYTHGNMMEIEKRFFDQSYYIYMNLSDPDDMDRFEFKKQRKEE